MASTSSVQCIPGSSRALPLFSQYDCEGSSGVDVLAQDVSRLPGSEVQAFGYCFPPPVMVGHIVEHSAECHAHAVIVVPDTRAHWYPLVKQGMFVPWRLPRRIWLGAFSDLTRTERFMTGDIPNGR